MDTNSLEQRAVADLAPIRAALNSASHIPGHYYTSQEVFDLECERLFKRDWMAVARVEEVERPGDYLALRVVNEPFIVCRDLEGELHAFVNRCAHRGVAVTTEAAGNTKEFTCPYHGWLYGLDGRLIGAPYMDQADGFDKANCRLKPLQLRTWGGWIYVSLDYDPMPWEEWIAPYAAEFDFLQQESCRLADKLVLEVGCNWKFPVENLMDNYHSRVLHVKTIGRTMGVERFTGVRSGSNAFTAYYDARPMNYEGKSSFGAMPWMGERSERFACSAHLSPNFHLLARVDNVHPILMWPIGKDRVRIECYMLWPKEWHELPDFKERVAPYNQFTLDVLKEDASVMESLHDAASSNRFEPGRLSRLELGVYNLINYNLDRLLQIGDRRLYTKS